ncbi:zinc-dependent alcohol dehydrogenase [Nocardioides sp. WG-D5]
MTTMRALVVPAPGVAEVRDVPTPEAAEGEVVVAVERVGVCGTDMELFAGTMAYLEEGHTTFPLRLGHEWTGSVVDVGRRVNPTWTGRRVTGDTMIGCGKCRRCQRGHHHVCGARQEVGVRDGRPGALAEYVAIPAVALRALPDAVDPTLGALIEPGGNAFRAAQAASSNGEERVLVMGPGTIGLLTAMFLRAAGVEVHVLGAESASLDFVRSLGFTNAWDADGLPRLPFDAVVDASNAPRLPALAIELVEPAGRLVYIGLAGEPSLVDTRDLVLGDITAVGILSASPGLDSAIHSFATGAVDPRPLVAATLGLGDIGPVLAGRPPGGAGPGPKIHVDPRL